jgi:predicted phage gp36 major capsid-like protein
MRDISEIRAERDAVRERLDRITRDKEVALASDAESVAERVDNLARGEDRATEQLASLDAELKEAIRETARDGRNTVSAWEAPVGAQSVRTYDENVPANVRAAHDAGLRAVERAKLDSEAGDRLERHIRYKDPQGIVSRYIAGVSEPAYESAFAKMLGDPAMAHLKFSPAEVEAVRKVTQVEAERALVTTTTGVPIPFQLDPTLIYAGTGALNPFRRICRVETITEGTWKGVNTQDVTLAYSAEAVEVADNTRPWRSHPSPRSGASASFRSPSRCLRIGAAWWRNWPLCSATTRTSSTPRSFCSERAPTSRAGS